MLRAGLPHLASYNIPQEHTPPSTSQHATVQGQSSLRHLVLPPTLGLFPWPARRACFDEDFYRKENPDLAELDKKLGRESIPPWEHYLVLGQFQGRTHK
jgi:hypothetical protein